MSSALQEKPGADDLPKVSGASILLDGRYLPPPADKDGKQWVRTTALVQADPEFLYAMWSDLESIPLWQEEIAEVRVTGPKTSQWVMKSGEKTVEWDSEILADEPGKRIAWRSTAGDVHQAGEVIFEEAPGGRGTTVIVLQEFGISGIASAIATIVDRNPKQAVVENLRHFKALAETGEIPRSQNAPHGDRGVIGGFKRSAYGEKVPTPPGV
jgi:uncharacterized membrane protein